MPEPDKTKTSQQEEITNEMLEKSLAEVVEEEKVEEKEVDKEEEKVEEVKEEEVEEEKVEVKEEVEDNKDRSMLGRRVSSMEHKMEEFLNRAESLLKPPKKEEPEEVQFQEDEFVTVKDLRKFISYETDRMSKANKKYSDDYLNNLFELSKEMDEETVKALGKEIDTNYNRRRFNNPAIDAKMDFLEAYKSILETKVKIKKNPLDKNKDKIVKGIGNPNTEKVKSKGFKSPELDELSKDYIKRMGLSEKDVEEALKDDIGFSLSGKKDVDMRDV